ncbi:MAG: M20 metallopeptidase family protein [Clostridia bacterium]
MTIDQELIEWVIRQRRYLHENPELSGEEHETRTYLLHELNQMNLEVLSFDSLSVVACLKGTEGRHTIALRADMDALPVQEEGDKPALSNKPGVSHVCGHDGHIAILLGAAKWLSQHREQVKPNVLFIFQSSEEISPSGAEELVSQGVLEQVDAIFGIHLWQPLEKGKIGLCSGPMMASCDDFEITVNGKGGHGSMPDQTIDPIYIAGHLITAIQSIVSRQTSPIDPAVISIGKVVAGTGYNVIPSTATLSGTIRTFSQEVRQRIPVQLEELVTGICKGFGATANVSVYPGLPPVVNDRDMVSLAERILSSTQGAERIEYVRPVMGAEDFAHYLLEKPGAFLFVGMNGEKSAYPHHHPRFDLDEDVFPLAISLWIDLVLQFESH